MEAGKFVSWEKFLSREHLAMSRDILWGKVATDVWWAEVRDAAKHPAMPRTAPLSPRQRIILPQTSIVLRPRNLGIGDTVGRYSGQGLGKDKQKVCLPGSY